MRLGTGELVLIFIVALMVFGPKQLPELGKMVGKAVGSCKYYMDSFTNECKGIEDDLKDVDRELSQNPVPTVRKAAATKEEASASEETAVESAEVNSEENIAEASTEEEKSAEPVKAAEQTEAIA